MAAPAPPALTRHRKLDLAQVWRQRLINRLPITEIARIHGVSKQAISQACQRLDEIVPDLETLHAYREVKPALFDAVEQRLMASLVDPEAIAKASLNNRAYAFTQIHTAGRLERGQSTANVGLLSKMIEGVHEGLFAPAVDKSHVENQLSADAETPRQSRRSPVRAKASQLT